MNKIIFTAALGLIIFSALGYAGYHFIQQASVSL
jgi:hypothetical protein